MSAKKNAKKKRHTGLKIFIFLILVLAIIWASSNLYLQTVKYTVTSADLPEEFDGFKMVQISDLHSMSFGKDNSRLVSSVNSQNPDIVVMTGDMINSDDTDFSVFYNLAEKLAETNDVYYIVGNHEQEHSEEEIAEIYRTLTEIGVNVLDNERVTITRSGSSIDVYGLWFNLRYYVNVNDDSIGTQYYFDSEKIETVLGECDKERFTLLLAHNPVYFETYSDWGADITLAGHMHGGMVRIPFVGGLFSPEKEYFPKYASGMFTEGNSSMIVNRGLGNRVFGLRFWNCPEITVITLKSK